MSVIKTTLKPRDKDIGEMIVRRALPFTHQRSVGPWMFFDHFGPVSFAPGEGMNVRPHPHINLATVTYLFEGEIFHRDSLGYAQPILPGAINLMVAGRGIVHSERTRDALRESGYDLHGLQLWMALPETDEETDPAFYHHPAHEIPSLDIKGARVRVLMGAAYGLKSPVKTFSPTLYLDVNMDAGAEIAVPKAEELGLYVVEGEVCVDGELAPINAMTVLTPEAKTLSADQDCRFAIIGGQNLGPRRLWWNFASSRPERIEQAKVDWAEGRFEKVPGDADEFIPLPEK